MPSEHKTNSIVFLLIFLSHVVLSGYFLILQVFCLYNMVSDFVFYDVCVSCVISLVYFSCLFVF